MRQLEFAGNNKSAAYACSQLTDSEVVSYNKLTLQVISGAGKTRLGGPQSLQCLLQRRLWPPQGITLIGIGIVQNFCKVIRS